MPLSDHEQRMLDEMERQLFADDPRLARAFHQAGRPRRSRRRIVLGILGMVAGLALLVCSVALPAVWLGVVAFALMVASGIWTATAPVVNAGDAPRGPGSPADSTASSGAFMRRMEQRWDRRADEDPRA